METTCTALFVNDPYPWIVRGGYQAYQIGAGCLSVTRSGGYMDTYLGSRVVVRNFYLVVL